MYLGNTLQAAYSSYLLIDGLSASFNGTTTSFALKVNGVAPVPFPLNEQNVLISVGGVPQKPDPTGAEGFKFSGTNIVFSSAPKTGEAFWGVVLAGADYVNVGVSYPDGAAATPSITFNSNKTTGIYLAGVSILGFTTSGVLRSTIDSNGNFSVLSAGSATIPAVAVGTGTTYAPGIYSPGTDQLAIATGGTRRVFVDGIGNVGIGATPSAWGGLQRSIEFSGGSSLSFNTGAPQWYLNSNAYYNGTNWIYKTTGLANQFVGNPAGGGFIWNNAASDIAGNTITFTQAMTLDTSGRLGIGTTSPGQMLEVNGAAYITGGVASQGAYIFRDGGTGGAAYSSQTGDVLLTTTGATNIRFSTNSIERARIDTSGRLLVGTSSNSGGATCQVSGSVQASNTFRFPANTKNGGTCKPTAIETISTDGGTNTATTYGNARYGSGKWVLLAAFDPSGNAVSASATVGDGSTFVYCITNAATNFPTT